MKQLNKKFIFIIAILFISTILGGCNNSYKNQSLAVPKLKPPEEVKGKPYSVKRGSVSNLLTINGTLIAGKSEEVTFGYSEGVIKSIDVKSGDTVKKGEVLAELDTDELTTDIKVQELKLEKAQLSYEEMSKQKVDDITLKLALLEVSQQKLQLDILKEDLNKCVITSPFNGIVTLSPQAVAGQEIGKKSVFTVDSAETMVAKCAGENINKFRVGMKAKVTCDGEIYDGKVASVENSDKKDDSKYLIVRLAKVPDAKNYKSSIVTRVEVSNKDNVIVIPKSFIKTTNNYTYVNVVENKVKEQRFVVTGLETDEDIEIVNGLKEGEKITEN